jgi:hypothetical protein
VNDDNKPDVWQKQSQLDIEGLERALASADMKIRQRAAAALRTMKNTKALPALTSAFEKEEDAQTRLIIAAAIEALKDSSPKEKVEPSPEPAPAPAPQVPPSHVWLEKLNSESSEEVVEAARQLGELGDKIAVEKLILIFNDPKKSIQVRLAVAEALLKLNSAPVEVALLANLRHADWVIRRNGAAILGQLKAEWAIQPLARALSDAHPVVRRTALAALKHIGTPESRKALAKFSPSINQPNTGTKEPKKTVSGLDVKRVGKAEDKNQPSGMLKKLGGEQSMSNPPVDRSAASLGTRPLDSKILDDYLKRGNTQPINDSLLDSLDAMIEDAEKKEAEIRADLGAEPVKTEEAKAESLPSEEKKVEPSTTAQPNGTENKEAEAEKNDKDSPKSE